MAVKLEDHTEYNDLHQHYCEPYVEAEAPRLDGTSDARLRHPRRHAARLLSYGSYGKHLLKKIQKHKKSSEHTEAFRLLRALRTWEERMAPLGLGMPPALRLTSLPISEQVDLTEEQETVR